MAARPPDAVAAAAADPASRGPRLPPSTYADASTAAAAQVQEDDADEDPPPYPSALLMQALFWMAMGAAVPVTLFFAWLLAVALMGEVGMVQYYVDQTAHVTAAQVGSDLAALAPLAVPTAPAQGSVLG